MRSQRELRSGAPSWLPCHPQGFHQLRRIADFQLAVDRAYLVAHRGGRALESGGDLFVRVSFGDEPGHGLVIDEEAIRSLEPESAAPKPANWQVRPARAGLRLTPEDDSPLER